MGIQGLAKLITSKASAAIASKSLQNYKGQLLAIDASVVIYQFLIAMRGASHGTNFESRDGEVTNHLVGLWARSVGLLQRDIFPIFVFDGPAPKLKAAILQGRIDKCNNAIQALESDDLDGEMRAKLDKRTVRMNSTHVNDCKKLLSLMGLPFIQAEGEAEATCAALVKSGICTSLVTEDMDALTFGTPRLSRDLTLSKRKNSPTEIQLDTVLESLQLNMDQFVDLCILLGCDYCPKVPGLGLVRAYEGIQKNGCIENLLAARKVNNYNPNLLLEVRELFKNPAVTTCTYADLRPTAPDEQGIIQFLHKEKSFSPYRLEAGLSKLKVSHAKVSKKWVQLSQAPGQLAASTGPAAVASRKQKVNKEETARPSSTSSKKGTSDPTTSKPKTTTRKTATSQSKAK